MTSPSKALGDDHEAPLLVIPLWHVAFEDARRHARRAMSAPPWPRIVLAQLTDDEPLPPATVQQLQAVRIAVVRLPGPFAACGVDDPALQDAVIARLKGRSPTVAPKPAAPPAGTPGTAPRGPSGAPKAASSRRPAEPDIETVEDV